MDFLHESYRLVANYVSFIPLLIGMIKIKKLDRAFLFFLALIFAETTIAVIAKWLASRGIYNIPCIHALTFLEVLLAFPFFFYILEWRLFKRTVVILSTVFLIYTTYNSLFIQSLYEYNHIPRTLQGFLLVLYSFFYFYELLKSEKIINIYNSATFWAVVGFFTYFGTTQFVHLFSDYLREFHFEEYHIMREFNRIMIISYYSIFALALWKKK